MNEGDARQPIRRAGRIDRSPRDRSIRNNTIRELDNSHRREDESRRSLSFQPILSECTLGRFEPLFRRYHVRARTALVLVNKRGKLFPFSPEGMPTIGELMWKGPGTLYEVDMGLHWTRLEFELPSLNEAVPFRAVVDLEWRVDDPAKVVRNGIKDVRKALYPHLHHRLSLLTRKRSMDEVSAVEKDAFAWLTNQRVGKDYGLWTQVFIRMNMEEKIRNVRHDIAVEHETQVLRLLREESTTVLMNKRVERYLAIIGAGDYNQFALQLAQNPDEAMAVVKMLHENRRNVINFVTHLLDSGAIDRYEINDQVRAALEWLEQATDTVLHPLEQPARIPGQRTSDALPAAEMPRENSLDPQLVDPQWPPQNGQSGDAGKP